MSKKAPRHILPKYSKNVVDLGMKLRAEYGPGVYDVTVLHDDWCDLLAGKGPCNCNPVVRPGRPES